MHDITIFNYISFPLFFTIFLQFIFVLWMVKQIVRVDDLGVYEMFAEIAVDFCACLYCVLTFADRPCTDLVGTNCVEMDKFQILICCLYYWIYLGFLFFLTILFMLHWIFYVLCWVLPILSHCGFDLRQVVDFVVQVLLLWHVQKVDHWFWS